MGGLAFLQKYGVESIRLNANDYFNLCSEVEHKLEQLFDRVALIEAYHNKADFGDADFLVSDYKGNASLKSSIYTHFELENDQLIKNSSIYSILINDFQVDVILTKSGFFDTSLAYYNYDPQGNLNGRMTHKLGVHLGWDGLKYIVRSDTDSRNRLKTISLTDKFADVCDLLGLDYFRYLQGFDEKEDIYDWVISGKYFDHTIFSLENLNHINRTRNRKRALYCDFLEYIKTKNITSSFEFKPKAYYLDLLAERFPKTNLKERIAAVKEQDTRYKENKKKFNGNLVMEWYPSLKGKELGKVLEAFKRSFMFKDFNTVLAENSAEYMKSVFCNWYCFYNPR